MRRNLPIALALILAAYLAGRMDWRRHEAPRVGQNPPAAAAVKSTETAAGNADASPAPAKVEAVPAEFEAIDFRNFPYPISWRKQPVLLADGEFEYFQDESLGGSGWFNLKGADYADVTGDGEKEAIVRVISVQCGGSCDGGSHLLYFYSMRANKPALLWRIETGSLGYGCGLKSLAVGQEAVTIEVFNDCRFEGVSLDRKNEPPDDRPQFKFGTDGAFTRFRFEFDGKAFALKKREVFPYPEEDVKNFEPEIRVTHD
jgi:hypothetical protein